MRALTLQLIVQITATRDGESGDELSEVNRAISILVKYVEYVVCEDCRISKAA